MRRLILNALAFADKAGVPTQVKDVANVADVYIKNAFVSLTSAKINNPNVEVCLVTNRELQDNYIKLFTEKEIKIHVIPFDAFAIPNTFHWQLAFFKLFALEYIINNTCYSQYLLIDSDVYSTKNIDDFWLEIEDNSIMLYHLPSVYAEFTRKEIIEGYKILYGKQASITNFGGEFIAGNRSDLQDFSQLCMKTYREMLANLNKLSSNIGDEFVTSIAAYSSSKKVIATNAYISRFLTGRVYSCVTGYEVIPMWHLPIEKSYTMIKLFHYYIKHGHYPVTKQVAAWAGLPNNKRTHALPYFLYRIRQKIIKRIRKKFRR